jgi:hypothetical protein
MQLSKSATKSGIIQRATFFAFGDSLDHTAAWPLADMVASANEWVKRVSIWIFTASGVWRPDDSKHGDLPRFLATLVANQQDYSIKDGVFRIHRLEAKDSAGTWHKLIKIDDTEIPEALSEFMNTAGMPQYYRVDGGSIFLYPKPDGVNSGTTDALALEGDRTFADFTVPASYTTDSTEEPGFDSQLHGIIPKGMAFDWCLTNGPDDRKESLREDIANFQGDILRHVGQKTGEGTVKIKPKRNSYN